MKEIILMWELLFVSIVCFGQHYNSSSIFAHNDYLKPQPLTAAYSKQVGFIEADVFLVGDNLLVAHTRVEIQKRKTLEALYLAPLAKLATANDGFIYSNQEKTLTLMIDLKTDGEKTLPVLVEMLKKFPSLITCKNFRVAVSGNMPPPSTWNTYPDFIHFDGRPTILYTPDQLARLRLISDSFGNYSSWNGKGELNAADQAKLAAVVKLSHGKNKLIRFWGAPDNQLAWKKLIELNIDVINTDHVAEVLDRKSVV